MHLIVAFAAADSAACRQCMGQLALPYLQALLQTARPLPPLLCLPPDSYSTPDEHALAHALGWPDALRQDGRMPWAAYVAQAADLQQGQSAKAWAFITPCHWQIHADHIDMQPPALLDLDASASQALFSAIQPWFAETGLSLLPMPQGVSSPVQWLACGDMLQGLRTASLNRVSGRNVAHWMPLAAQAGEQTASAALHLLQSEIQMLLHTQPVNTEREHREQWPVNALWISGAGSLPPNWTAPATPPQVLRSLVEPALQENWPAWQQAWQTLDAEVFGPLAEAHRNGTLPALRITLCGEQDAASWQCFSAGWLNKAVRRLFPAQLPNLLQVL